MGAQITQEEALCAAPLIFYELFPLPPQPVVPTPFYRAL